MVLCRTLLLLGLAASGWSMIATLRFTWNPLFEAPALPEGPTHTNYHAFRGFALSVGAAAVLVWGMFQPVGRRGRELWVAMLLAALGYYGGWWLPWPLFGLHAPNAVATATHAAATVFALGAVGLSRRYFHDGRGGTDDPGEVTRQRQSDRQVTQKRGGNMESVTLVDPKRALQFFQDKLTFTTGPVELKHMQDQGLPVNVVDVRTAEDYARDHVPGSVNLPKDEWDSLRGLSKETTNVLVCYSEVCHLAAKAAVAFAQAGYPVMEMDGGMKAWKESKLPVESGRK